MASYVLIPGAGGDSFYWHYVVTELVAAGHEVVAPDLPAGDDSAGLPEYASAVVDAIGSGAGGFIVVAQSMGGFVAPLLCGVIPVRLIILVNAMVPAPDESPGAWWANTGSGEARRVAAERDGRSIDGEFDPVAEFLHDVPEDVIADVLARGEPRQSDTPFGNPWPLDRWPDVPTRAIISRGDRLFPVEFQRRVLRDRLGITADEMDGGHCVAWNRPTELASRLSALATFATQDGRGFTES
jgi:pimeloyl-ACP methyl ester carboxylesterase